MGAGGRARGGASRGNVRQGEHILSAQTTPLPTRTYTGLSFILFSSSAQSGLELRENDYSILQYKKINMFSCIVLMVLSI